MIPDRIEYLLMLARDERTENDDLIDKQNEIFAARAIRLLQLEELHRETGRILQEELKRFARWMPKGHAPPGTAVRVEGDPRQVTPSREQYEAMPKVVQQGPINPLLNPQMNLARKEK
jgi:hypothetical protein